MTIFVYTLVFSILHKFWIKYFKNILNFENKDLINLSGKINSCIHSLVIVPYSLLYLTGNITQQSYYDNALIFSKAYFIYDLFTTYRYHKHIQLWKEIFIHHILMLLMIIYAPVEHHIVIAQGYLGELTNFFLYGGWFLIKINKKKTKLFQINCIILLILFLMCRVVNLAYLIIYYRIYHNIYLFIYSFTLFVMNVRWFIKLSIMAKTLYIHR